jgi:hypothetical protein
MNKPMKSSFEAKYPSITRWVKEFTRTEIGYDFPPDAFSQALEKGLERTTDWSSERG